MQAERAQTHVEIRMSSVERKQAPMRSEKIFESGGTRKATTRQRQAPRTKRMTATEQDMPEHNRQDLPATS